MLTRNDDAEALRQQLLTLTKELENITNVVLTDLVVKLVKAQQMIDQLNKSEGKLSR